MVMKKMLVLTAILVMGYFTGSTLYYAGVFKNLRFHSELSDVYIYDDMAGTEDFALIQDKGLLFISVTDRWKIAFQQDSDSDGIYLMDLNSGKLPVLLQNNYQGEFHPHGISYFHQSGADFLFAVNHNKQGDFVELFQFVDNRLKHLRTFESELMCCPNDLVAVGLDKFYVTNDHGLGKDGIMRMFEDYLRIAESSVLYFDGSRYQKVYEDLNYANGIAVSGDGKTLYVTETTGGKLSVLNRNIETGLLHLKFARQINTGPDNITLDRDGNLWIAAHPKLLDFVAHSKNPKNISPSQILKLTPKGKDDFEVEEVYMNSGEEISGTSTAIRYQNKIYVGVVFEKKLLRAIYKD